VVEVLALSGNLRLLINPFGILNPDGYRGKLRFICHPEPFGSHSERSEESRSAQGKLREGSHIEILIPPRRDQNDAQGPSGTICNIILIAVYIPSIPVLIGR